MRELSEVEVAIADEAFTVGRIYSAMGEKEHASQIDKTLNEKCRSVAHAKELEKKISTYHFDKTNTEDDDTCYGCKNLQICVLHKNINSVIKNNLSMVNTETEELPNFTTINIHLQSICKKFEPFNTQPINKD